MTLANAFKPAGTWLPLQVPVISICFVGGVSYWSFPFYMSTSGAAFLLMYTLMLVFLMAPVMYMEMRLGGITKRGLFAMQAKYFPVSTGVGLALFIRLIILSAMLATYTCLALWYMFIAGTSKPGSPYPWATCSNHWNTHVCNITTVEVSYTSMRDPRVAPEEEYFKRHVITHSSEEWPHLGSIIPHLAGMLVLSWGFTFLLTCGGPRIFAWLVLIFGGLFFLILFILLGIGCSQFDGALNGLKYMFSPNFEKLRDFYKSWTEALETVLYMTWAWSYILPSVGKLAGKTRNMSIVSWIPILVTVVVVPLVVATFLGVFYGVVAEASGVHVGDVTTSGLDLTVHFLPTACRILELHPFVALLLFASQTILVALAQGLIVLVLADSILEGLYHRWLKAIKASQAMWRLLVTAVVCVLSLLISLPLVTQNGMDLLNIIDVFLHRLDFVYFGMLAVSLMIIFAQRRQLHLLERRVVIILVCFVGTLTALMRMSALILAVQEYTLYLNKSLFDTFSVLVTIGPLVLGLPVGVLYALLEGKGTFEQRFVHIFAGDQDDSDVSPQAPAPESYPMMAKPLAKN